MTTVFPTKVASKRHPFALLAALLAALLLAPSFASAQALGPTLQSFGVLAGSTVTNTGPTAVTGDVGVSPGAAITGFPPGSTTGTLRTADATANQGQTELTTAFNAAAAAVCTTNLTGQNLGGLVLTPGVYCFNAAALLTGNLTLDFLGNPNASFVFQTGSTLTTASGSSVLAVNTGGASCLPNINWQIGSSATLGTTASFAGNILALTSITLNTGANVRGRVLARNGAVTLDSNLSVGGCPIAPAFPGGALGSPGSGFIAVPTLQEWALIFLGLMLAGAGGWHVRRKSIAR